MPIRRCLSKESSPKRRIGDEKIHKKVVVEQGYVLPIDDCCAGLGLGRKLEVASVEPGT
jgi:hypothetical protein